MPEYCRFLISIHTSAREVTYKPTIFTLPFRFQSTLPQGKWHMDCGKLGGGDIFQSTLPQGKWRITREIYLHVTKFQSTLPQGKWHRLRWCWRCNRLFQSTLPQGKWRILVDQSYRYLLFQSTLPQGKWLQYSTKTSVYFYEISINIFEFTFVYYWNTLSIQKAHSNLFIFTGASLPVILCMLDTRTCKL